MPVIQSPPRVGKQGQVWQEQEKPAQELKRVPTSLPLPRTM